MSKPGADALYKAETARYVTFTPTERKVLQSIRRSRKLCLAEAARELFMARGTVQYYIDRIKRKTGLDPQTYDGLRACLERMEGEHERL